MFLLTHPLLMTSLTSYIYVSTLLMTNMTSYQLALITIKQKSMIADLPSIALYGTSLFTKKRIQIFQNGTGGAGQRRLYPVCRNVIRFNVTQHQRGAQSVSLWAMEGCSVLLLTVTGSYCECNRWTIAQWIRARAHVKGRQNPGAVDPQKGLKNSGGWVKSQIHMEAMPLDTCFRTYSVYRCQMSESSTPTIS